MGKMKDLMADEWDRAYRQGYDDALDAAAKDLGQLEADMSNWSSDETRAATSVIPGLTAKDWIWAQHGVGRSVQIIRALQSEQQTSELQGKP